MMGRRQPASRRNLTTCSLLAVLALLLLVAACGGSEKSSASQSQNDAPATLDLERGSFGGVALGDAAEEMHQVFGPKSRAEENERITALSVGDDPDYSPPVLTLEPQAGPAADSAYRYENVVFVIRGSRIGAIIVNDPGARARDTDVGIGDKLARAKAAYDLECGTANEGTEYEPFPACVGRTAPHVFVWLGNDPITNITLARVRPDGV
jgi:hypothetical protein